MSFHTRPHIDFTACQFNVVSLHSPCKASRASTQKPHILYLSCSFARGLKIIGLWSRSLQRDLRPGVDSESPWSTESHANDHICFQHWTTLTFIVCTIKCIKMLTIKLFLKKCIARQILCQTKTAVILISGHKRRSESIESHMRSVRCGTASIWPSFLSKRALETFPSINPLIMGNDCRLLHVCLICAANALCLRDICPNPLQYNRRSPRDSMYCSSV